MHTCSILLFQAGRAVVYFLVGVLQDEIVMKQIVEESRKYNDLIVTSLDEDYYKLTLKVGQLTVS